ncbi:MAG: hypothetical protein PVI90_12980 [Desulfobacteraceae bacterium]|jgi:hypothetical protein
MVLTTKTSAVFFSIPIKDMESWKVTMFKIRSKNEEIEFLILETPLKMPPGKNIPKDGDSVVLKYENYRIIVIGIKTVTETSFCGIVEQIKNVDERDVFEIGSPPNIAIGDEVDFLMENIFECIRD